MRKTNNRDGIGDAGSEAASVQYWVVYDEDTDEYLVSFGTDPGSATWAQLPGLDSDDPGAALDMIGFDARFDDFEEAQEAAEALVQEISDEHPNDEIVLDVRRIEVRHVLHVEIFAGEGGASLDPNEGNPAAESLREMEDDDPDILGTDDECCNEVCDDSCVDAPDHDDVLEGRTKKPKKSKKRKR